jgi:LacI family transcriptional regulator
LRNRFAVRSEGLETLATVKDVARRAGVSTSTVSHVLNETRWVSDELRRRVLDASDELGFEPNAVARSLKIKRSFTIGLVISDIGNPFFTAVVRGVEDMAQGAGYTVILGNSDEDPDKEEAYLRILSAKRIDGLILAPTGQTHDYLRRLVGTGFPLVLLDRIVPELSAPAVLLDNQAAARDAVEHLITLGHRTIGMVAGKPHISSTVDRLAGYRQALEEAGIAFDEGLVVSGGSQIDAARRATGALLERRNRPSALFVANNLMTIGAVAAIEDHDLLVPDDVAVVGFDDFPWANVFRPTLTCVAQPTYELGRAAAELVLRAIDGTSDASEQIVLHGELIVRESSGATLRPAARGRRLERA